MPSMPNPERTAAIISAIATILAIGLIFLPRLIQMDGMRGGYALSFVSFFVAVSAAATTLFFWGRAKSLDHLLVGNNLLAHWTYESTEWQRYTEAEWQEQVAEKAQILLIILVWALLIGGLFWLLDPEAGWIVLLVMLGLILLLAGLTYGLPRLWFARHRFTVGEAWIATTAIYFSGNFVRWNYWGVRLEQVDLLEQEGNVPACLCFYLSYPSRAGRQIQNLRIPVPQGCETEAYEMLYYFTRHSPS